MPQNPRGKSEARGRQANVASPIVGLISAICALSLSIFCSGSWSGQGQTDHEIMCNSVTLELIRNSRVERGTRIRVLRTSDGVVEHVSRVKLGR